MTSDKILKGLFLIGVGSILLLYQLGYFPTTLFPYFLFSWPSLLIVIGIFLLIAKPEKGGGITVLAIGVFFLLQKIYHFNPFQYWPVFIIIAGLGILFKRRHHTPTTDSDSKTYKLNQLDEINIFSGGERIVTSSEFTGGSVVSVFGGCEINLLNSKLAEGRSKLEVLSIFGGSTFFVPSDWKVRVEVVAIFGGFSDKRRIFSSGINPNDGELVIKGFVLFGGGEIKSL